MPRIGLFILVLCTSLLLSGCSWTEGMFAAAGPVALVQKSGFMWIVGLMMIVILPMLIAQPFVL